MTDEEKQEQAKLYEELATCIRTIVEYQTKFDLGYYKTYDAAMVLERARSRRRAILKLIKPVYLAWSHPFPDTLPEPEIPTRNEVRELGGLPPLSIEEGGNEKVR